MPFTRFTPVDGPSAPRLPPGRPCRSFGDSSRIIAIAASAGGLQAIERVLAPLPIDLDAAILVVQHVAPDRASHLAEILARATALPVREAQSGARLERGTVFVAPPDRHLLVKANGTITLSLHPPVNFSRPSADELFRSVAEHFRNRVIAVVLTGMGSDGTAATLTVHSHGGVVIAQNEATSQFFGMPGAAIASGHVDRILPLDDIAIALMTLSGTASTV